LRERGRIPFPVADVDFPPPPTGLPADPSAKHDSQRSTLKPDFFRLECRAPETGAASMSRSNSGSIVTMDPTKTAGDSLFFDHPSGLSRIRMANGLESSTVARAAWEGRCIPPPQPNAKKRSLRELNVFVSHMLQSSMSLGMLTIPLFHFPVEKRWRRHASRIKTAPMAYMNHPDVNSAGG